MHRTLYIHRLLVSAAITFFCSPTSSVAQDTDLVKDFYLRCHSRFMKCSRASELLDVMSSNGLKLAKMGGGIGYLDNFTEFNKSMVPQEVVVDKIRFAGNRATISAHSFSSIGASKAPTPSGWSGYCQLVHEPSGWKYDSEFWSAEPLDIERLTDTSTIDWCKAVDKTPYDRQVLQGSVEGKDVQITRTTYNAKQNVIELAPDRKDGNLILIYLPDDALKDPGKEVVLTQSDCSIGFWSIRGHRAIENIFDKVDGFGLKLRLGSMEKGQRPCWLLMRRPDKQKSFLNGYFKLKST